MQGLYLVYHGEVEVFDENGMAVSILGPRNSFGERGLTRDGIAVTTASANAAGEGDIDHSVEAELLKLLELKFFVHNYLFGLCRFYNI